MFAHYFVGGNGRLSFAFITTMTCHVSIKLGLHSIISVCVCVVNDDHHVYIGWCLAALSSLRRGPGVISESHFME